jgi:hypothetical protein
MDSKPTVVYIVLLMSPSLYEGSTQFRHWRYSPQQLTHIRTSLNAAAVDAIRKTIEADQACTYNTGPFFCSRPASQAHPRQSRF